MEEYIDNTTEACPAEQFLEKIKNALTKHGDFPASARVVNELKDLTSNPRTTAQQVAEVILREPSLSTRILSLVNSSFYRRAKPIMTISQAVVAVGMKAIADLCAGLVLIQRFTPLSGKGGVFADSLKKSFVTSLLASTFSAEIGGSIDGKGNELGYITGFFSEIGMLLVAYYFPKLFESAARRAESKQISFDKALQELIGLDPLKISCEVIKELGLPKFFIDSIIASRDKERLHSTNNRSLEEQKILIAAKSVSAGYSLSSAIQLGTKEAVDEALQSITNITGVEPTVSSTVLGKLPILFSEHCAFAQVSLPPLPNFIKDYSPTGFTTTIIETESNEQFQNYIDEIREAVENREPTASIITSVMETFAYGLGFERVLLLLYDNSRNRLGGRMMIGNKEGIDPLKISIKCDDANEPLIAQALRSGTPQFQGQPILKQGWPFVLMPLGTAKIGVGIIYADYMNQDFQLTEKTRAAIGLMSELLERAIRQTR